MKLAGAPSCDCFARKIICKTQDSITMRACMEMQTVYCGFQDESLFLEKAVVRESHGRHEMGMKCRFQVNSGFLSLLLARDYNCVLRIYIRAMKSAFSLLLLFSSFATAQPDSLPAAPLLTARSYLLYDYTSNQILANQNGDARMEPASLSKLMTAYLTFDALKHDTLSADQRLTVPAAATQIASGESRMLLKTGQSVTVDELLRGLIVQSANDAAITLALNIAGSEAGFVDQMNKEAKRLGMKNTHFTNAVGRPDAQHYSSAYDLALLAAAIVRDYPQHYPLFSLREYTFNKVTQANRNLLLWLDPYADGIKTGHTETAGYCLVGSAVRDNHRMISVLFGADSDRLRAAESQKLLNFGFQQFDAVRLYKKDQPVSTVHVWKGTEDQLAVGFRRDVNITIPKGTLAQLKAKVVTSRPILAPVSRGQQLGLLKLTLDGKPYAEFPVVALESVPLANVFSRGWDNMRLLFE